MININKDAPNSAVEKIILKLLTQYYEEARGLLRELPEDINIWLDNWYLSPETGAGGFAYSPTTLTLSFDESFNDQTLQAQGLRAVVMHESYHIVQGHTYTEPSATYRHALDSAIYEGCATVFEREYANGILPIGDYKDIEEAKLQQWAEALANISNDDYRNGETGLWIKWALYDKETKDRWKAYRVGTWIVDRALKKSGKDILDFRTLDAQTIHSYVEK